MTRCRSCSISRPCRSSIGACRTRRSTWWSRPSRGPSSTSARRSTQDDAIATTEAWAQARVVDAIAGAIRPRPDGTRAPGQARANRRPRPRDRGDHRDPAAQDETRSRCCSARPARARRRSSRAWRSASPRTIRPRSREPLRDVRLFDVALLPLAEAIATDATLLRDFLAEARHPSVIVFFDEIHLLASPAVSNLAQALKPSLARGEIACVGATTGEEYQANIEPDAALARRFTQIAVEPMDARTVRVVLKAVRDSLTKSRGVTMGDEVLDEAIALADQFLPNRSFPDKGVDIIEQSIAHALRRRRQGGRCGRDARSGPARSWACRSIRLRGLPPCLPTCAIGHCSSPPATDALLVPTRRGAARPRLELREARRRCACSTAPPRPRPKPWPRSMATRPLRAVGRGDRHRSGRADRGPVDLDAARLRARAGRQRTLAAAPRAASRSLAGCADAWHRPLRHVRSATRSPRPSNAAPSPIRWVALCRLARPWSS